MNRLMNPKLDEFIKLVRRPSVDQSSLNAIVRDVIDHVKLEGDEALRSYAKRFDGVALDTLSVSETEFQEATKSIDDRLRVAIEHAANAIENFHAAQIYEEDPIETNPGVVCWRKSIGIDSVGLYIPGGSAPLFSSVLMLAIPARLARCESVFICTPPNNSGSIHPAILYAARFCGVSRVFKVGGAQAIAAMAYGTDSIPKASKIFGPGNQYVTKAKQLVNADGVAIDMPAGPTELVIVADEGASAKVIAADVLSQAEHGIDSQVLVFSQSNDLLSEVEQQIDIQLSDLPRATIAMGALENSYMINCTSSQRIIDLLNEYAPEHLILALDNTEIYESKLKNAGSVFVGYHTPESAGDYASGTNHTLPTAGAAKAYSGVSVDSFVKKVTFQNITRDGLKSLGPTIITMAEAEELVGHARAVSIRLAEVE